MLTADDLLKRECAFVLANPWAASVSVSQPVAVKLLSQGVVQELAALLKKETPNDLLVVALEGLHDAVKTGQQVCVACKHAQCVNKSQVRAAHL